MSARFTLEGTGTGAVKVVEALNKALDATEKEAEGAAKSTKRLADEARRITEAVNPQEKYNRKMQELVGHAVAGRIKIDDVRAAAEKYGRELERAGDSGNRVFGNAGMAQLVSYAAGLGTVTAVVSALKEAFQQAESASQSAADAIFDSLGAFVELQQLGKEGFARGAAISQRLVANGTVKPTNRAQATDIASNLINAEFSDQDIDYIVEDLAKIVKPENLTSVGGDLRKIQRQFGEGDLGSLSDRVLAAANITQADLAQTSREVLKFSSLAKNAVSGTNQALAAFVVSEGLSASPEGAAEAQKSFFSQVKRRRLGGGDLYATLDNIQSKIKPGGTAFDVLGDANAVTAFDDMQKNRDLLRDIEGRIAGADSVASRGDLIEDDPILNAARLRARAEGRSSVAEETSSAERESLFDAYVAELNQRGAERGEWAVTRWFRNKDLQAADTAGIEADAFRAEIMQTGLTGQRVSDELLAAMKDYLRRIEGNQRAAATTRPE